MKLSKILVILVLVLSVTGCKEYGEKRIVKLLTISDDKISIYYYDYSADKPSYNVAEKENTGIENTLVQLLSDHEYDLKMCRYVVCDSNIIENNIEELFNGLVNSKFSMDTVIIQGDTDAEPEKYTELKKYSYPIYSYYVENGKINGIAENATDNTKNVIADSKLHTILTQQQSFAFDIIKNNIDNGTYVFEHNGVQLSANLENITVFCTVKNDTAHITVDAMLKSFKGMPSNKTSKQQFMEIAQNSIKNNIIYLLDDRCMTENLKLNWFDNLGSCNAVDIQVNLK